MAETNNPPRKSPAGLWDMCLTGLVPTDESMAFGQEILREAPEHLTTEQQAITILVYARTTIGKLKTKLSETEKALQAAERRAGFAEQTLQAVVQMGQKKEGLSAVTRARLEGISTISGNSEPAAFRKLRDEFEAAIKAEPESHHELLLITLGSKLTEDARAVYDTLVRQLGNNVHTVLAKLVEHFVVTTDQQDALTKLRSFVVKDGDRGALAELASLVLVAHGGNEVVAQHTFVERLPKSMDVLKNVGAFDGKTFSECQALAHMAMSRGAAYGGVPAAPAVDPDAMVGATMAKPRTLWTAQQREWYATGKCAQCGGAPGGSPAHCPKHWQGQGFRRQH